MIAVALVPQVIGVVVVSSASGRALSDEAGRKLQSVALDTAAKIDRNLFERYGDVQAFAFNPKARADAPDVSAIADFYTRSYAIYDLMLVADATTGRVLATNTADAEGKPLDVSELVGLDVSNTDWFRQALQLAPGASYTGDLERNDLARQVLRGEGLELPFAAPVFDDAGQVVRVWLNLASFDRIVNDIMEEQVSTLRSIGVRDASLDLIQADGTVLFDPDPDKILTTHLPTGSGASGRALRGRSGHVAEGDQVAGYAGSKGAYTFEGYGWGVVARQPADSALAAATDLRNLLLVAAAVTLLASLAVVWLVIRRVSSNVGTSVSSLRDAAGRLTSDGEALDRASDETATAAAETAALARAVSEQVVEASAAVEQMTATVAQIAAQTSAAASVADDGVRATETTHECMSRLRSSTAEIDEVVALIHQLAAQTNMLALNATIEAARAGEAGRGFAVVAGEVKNLAAATTGATEEITQRVGTIQADSDSTLQSLVDIAELVGRISESQGTISLAVDEQQLATEEIARRLSQASSGSESIAASVDQVAATAERTRELAGQVGTSAAAVDDGAGAITDFVGA